ncbi:MAG TPA: CocE/NonD family hydrolase [Acidimicrobiales bacterium]|nr:CocE/NonD family hydrolase [Acidimicrobiales bacterium]
MARGRLVVVLAALASVAAGLTLPSGRTAGASAAPVAWPDAVVSPTAFAGHGSIDEAYALNAPPGVRLVLVDRHRAAVGHGVTDRFGSLIVRSVAPGPGYRFALAGGRVSAPFRVLAPTDVPPPSFYADQHLHAGLNYLTMRDGIQLAATVRLPPGATLAGGPFPTVIEDSGYAIAAPHSLIAALVNPSRATTSDPLLPDSATVVGSVIAPLLGFATVSLQMRGTGCSGGAFGLFDLPSTYDGYDAVETVAAQPWVLGHRVGMVGISFSGISQLFVAGTRPPQLAAIAPMSVTDDLYSTGYPGGIFNKGFAANWLSARLTDTVPAPEGGQPYARALIAAGDRRCLFNQRLRLQVQNAFTQIADNPHRTPSLFDPRSPTRWAQRIDVPVFLVGALQDEQTGPQWPALIGALRHDPHVFVTMVNGTHIDSLGPASVTRWIEFLDVYVAHRVPTTPAVLSALAGPLYRQLIGAPAEPLPRVRFTNATSAAAARAAFERADPRVRVLFDNGGGSLGPGAFQPEWEADLASWPPPGTTTTFDLGDRGALGPSGGHPGTAAFRPDPAARPAVDLAPSANVWAALPPYHWAPVTGTTGLGFVTAPLPHDLVVLGPASLDLWLSSSAPDTDLQVTVSEVRPDGRELYVQSGFLRASDRALSPASTATDPVPTYAPSTAHTLPAGRFTLVRVPIDPVAYAFRAGSRLRISITAPGGDRPEWAFGTYPTGGSVTDRVALGGPHPSALVLDVDRALSPPDPQPACPSLRGQPCRTYVPAGNGG